MKKHINLTAITKAISSLEQAMVPPPKNDRERDGAIQRFEYTLELCWKVGQRVLKDQGIVSNSPKSVFRDLAKLGLVKNPEAWLDFVDCRNETSHLYKEDVAEKVFTCLTPFLSSAQELLRKFEEYAQTDG